SDPNSLEVGAMVLVAKGANAAPLRFTAKARAADVTITATLGQDQASGHMRVLDASDVPRLSSLAPAMLAIGAGATAMMTVSLGLPARPGGGTVMLSAETGMVPMSVVVPEDAVGASFAYTQMGMGLMDTVTATLGNDQKTATVSVVSHPVINEIDYD